MDLVELDKQIKDKKVLSVFKDGVADGLLYGVRDDKQTHHYYKLGYEFGLTMYENEKEKKYEDT